MHRLSCGTASLENVDRQALVDHVHYMQKLGRLGDLDFLTKHQKARVLPELLLDNAKTCLSIVIPYLGVCEPKPVAAFARVANYHQAIPRKLEPILRKIMQMLPEIHGRLLIDTPPFFEKAHAEASGLGKIGRHTLLIHPLFGSSFFIASWLTDAKEGELRAALRHIEEISLEDNRNFSPNCSYCNCCIDACPTGALDTLGLDCRKCLSYLSIEHRGEIEEKFHPYFAETVFGCDICQRACPHNQRIADKIRTELGEVSNFLDEISWPLIENWPYLTQKDYETNFGGTSLTRAKIHGLKRNAQLYLKGRMPQ